MQVTEKAIKSFLITLILGHCIFAYSQKEGSNWYFGYQAGLTFNSGNPVALSKSPMNADGGSASISTNKGRLLFYSDGYHVWDSTHTVLSNTIRGLGGHQTVVIVPRPDSSHLYYIFTVGSPTSASLDTGSFYSEINLKLRSGLGDFIPGKVNIPLVAPSCGKLTAVRHANRKDYWVITQKYHTDTLYAYLITSTGINKPVLSKTGFIVGAGNNGTGAMKVSPDGKRICSVNFFDSSIIGDFDAATGKVSNIWKFEPTSGYGLEFSSKTKFLYTLGTPSDTRLSQYDLSSRTKQQFIASRKTIDTIFYNFTPSLQLGLDQKIYISPRNLFYLHVIKNPDMEGSMAQPERNYIYLGGQKAGVGLPDMIQSYFQKKTFGIRPVCTRDTVFFEILNTYNLDSARWDFGDTLSGGDNFSKKTRNIFHVYKKPGEYSVRLISYHQQFIDTIYETFFLNYPRPYLGNDTIICNGQSITLIPNGTYKSYKWSNDSTNNYLQVYKAGTYMLTVTDYDGCSSSDTIMVKSVMVKASATVNDTMQCLKGNSFEFKETSSYINDKRNAAKWEFSDGVNLYDSITKKTFAFPGAYRLKLISESVSGCKDSFGKMLYVYPQSHFDFSINDTVQCFNTQSFDFSITKDTGKVSYEWDLGDGSVNNSGDITGKRYAKDDNYKISLVSTTAYTCKDTISKNVTVLSSPKAAFTSGVACSNTATEFIYLGSKPVQTFVWDFNGEESSNYENPSKLFTTIGNKKIKLEVIADNGCTDTLSENIIVRIQSKADFTVNDVCETDSAHFNNLSQDATDYFWKFGDGNTAQKKSPKHLYHISNQSITFNVTLIAIVSDGCSDSITKAVTINPKPISDFTFIKTGKKLELMATQPNNSRYQWKFGNSDSIITTSANYSHTITSPEQSKVCLKVTDIAGCISQTCKDVTLSIFRVNAKSGFNLYPNPNRGGFTLEIPNSKGTVYLEILNQIGQIVYNSEFNKGRETFDLNLPDGLYLLRMINGENTLTQRMVVYK